MKLKNLTTQGLPAGYLYIRPYILDIGSAWFARRLEDELANSDTPMQERRISLIFANYPSELAPLQYFVVEMDDVGCKAYNNWAGGEILVKAHDAEEAYRDAIEAVINNYEKTTGRPTTAESAAQVRESFLNDPRSNKVRLITLPYTFIHTE